MKLTKFKKPNKKNELKIAYIHKNNYICTQNILKTIYYNISFCGNCGTIYYCYYNEYR